MNPTQDLPRRVVEIAPVPPLDGYDPSLLEPLVTPFVESLRAVYQAEAARYITHIELVTQASLGETELTVVYETYDGGSDDVTIDADLFNTLFSVYLCDGWPAIKDIEARLLQHVGVIPTDDPPSAGFVDETDPWLVAYRFFLFTRNLLAALIRDALIEIEQKAAAAMAASLPTSAAVIDSAFAAFGIDPASGQPTQTTPRLAAATAGLRDAVAVRHDLDATVAQLAQLAQQQEAYWAQQSGQSGTPPPQTPFGSAEFTAQLKTEATALHEQLRQWYAIASHQVAINEPMALVLVEGLPAQFTEEEVATRLAPVLTKLRDSIAELVPAIDPQQSRAAHQLAALPGLDRAAPGSAQDTRWRPGVTPIDPAAVYQLVVPADGPELAVINAALLALSSDRGALALLQELTWRQLVATGDIAVDSATYVVHHQYLLALDRRLEEQERIAAQNAAMFQVLGRISAGLSVASLALLPFAPTGIGALAAGAMRGAAAIIDAVVFVSLIYNVVDQLSKFDTAMASGLVAPGASAMPGVAAVGSLVRARSEYRNGMAVELLGELMLQAVGSRWLVTKRALVARGFVMDMETVLGFNDVDEDGE